ncbi:MAG TPA: hypothetical protein VGQ99_11065 [Tepidisphaeraceae bacterium]|jgi:hypothetical protein|nr:hypothetical protein [Tepidisphaeraceae bacterium]HEV8605900.1 hypothetical protein [Tepidisphaeraceae bacterium]
MAKKTARLRSLPIVAEQYKQAAQDRSAEIGRLYQIGLYGLAIYVAGVAVECIFRAYRAKKSSEMDARHDLHQLSRGGFREVLPPHQLPEFGTALTALAVRWTNSHRYRSDNDLRLFLKRAELDRTIRGDFLKENARVAAVAANTIVKIGLSKWTEL